MKSWNVFQKKKKKLSSILDRLQVGCFPWTEIHVKTKWIYIIKNCFPNFLEKKKLPSSVTILSWKYNV